MSESHDAVRPISIDEIIAWFELHGWQRVVTTPHELVFHSGKDLPEGLWRQARVDLDPVEHRLAVWIIAWNGERRRLANERSSVPFSDEVSLAAGVGQFGVSSWKDPVIDPFAAALGLPPARSLMRGQRDPAIH